MAASAAVELHRLGSGADNKLDKDVQKCHNTNATVVLRRENGEAQRGPVVSLVARWGRVKLGHICSSSPKNLTQNELSELFAGLHTPLVYMVVSRLIDRLRQFALHKC
jgi:hypothetical protein